MIGNVGVVNLEENDTYKKHKSHLILEGYRGSQAHGTYVQGHPDSIDDIDLMGIVISDLDHYLGLKHFETQEIKHGQWDVVIYDLKKFVSLLLKQNPNVCSLLWLKPEFYTHKTSFGDLLIKNRDIFVSKKAFIPFSGYAHSQLSRMTHFQAYEGYMGAKRKKLVDKYGYDCKNACHLIRLLKMCIEFLDTGVFNVYREDREMLMEIKHGKWQLKTVQDLANDLFIKSKVAYQKSQLPEEPDYKKANELLVQIILEAHNLYK